MKTLHRLLLALTTSGVIYPVSEPLLRADSLTDAPEVHLTQTPMSGRRARVIVKANHRGEGVSLAGVFEEPKRFLTGYAVMALRERGYHPDHADWFWAVFNPDGSLRKFNVFSTIFINEKFLWQNDKKSTLYIIM